MPPGDVCHQQKLVNLSFGLRLMIKLWSEQETKPKCEMTHGICWLSNSQGILPVEGPAIAVHKVQRWGPSLIRMNPRT